MGYEQRRLLDVRDRGFGIGSAGLKACPTDLKR
jgi:hypothetical protein